jgi:hypothetical protein
MFTLTLFLYGTDLDQLNHREYAVREAAQARLERAGWWAAPALWQGMQAGSPEAAERCTAAWAKLMAGKSLPILACRLIDRTGRFDKDRDSWRWVRLKPYLNGSMENDLRYALDMAKK